MVVSENDDRRVEARLGAITGGYNATADKIQEIQARAAKHERLGRLTPKERFGAILKKGKNPDPEQELSEKEKKYESLPKGAPRPNGISPSFRAKLGLGNSEEDIVLKG